MTRHRRLHCNRRLHAPKRYRNSSSTTLVRWRDALLFVTALLNLVRELF